jgi:hypothetical protein
LLKNPQIYEVIPIELLVDMKIIKVACRIMLENLVILNVYLKINLKGEIFIWGNKIHSVFMIHYFWNI